MKSLILIFGFLIIVFIGQSQTQFIWPLKAMPAYSEITHYYSINNFVDQNTGSGIQDWNCGTRTYNGHRGIDIDLWPFFWDMMTKNYVAVVAAAPGTVVAVDDGQNNETNCGPGPYANSNWNYIAIRHADNSTSLYGHIRNNSAQVAVGDVVAAGDVIAFVGSSGSSSNPHLHFEVNSQPVLNSQVAGLIDPYTGSCNSLNANSWWAAQKPYWEPAIVRVMTHGNRPVLPGYNNNSDFCPTGEAKNAKAAFVANDSIYFGIAMRDFQQGQTFTLSVFDQNGSMWFTENFTNNSGFDLERVYYTSDQKLPSAVNSGTYRAVVDYNGTSFTHFFSVNCPATQNVTGTITGNRGFKASNTITTTASVTPVNKLFLQAGTRITLSPGFVAGNGSSVRARINDCNYSE